MAFDAFLKIDTIPGESKDSKHKDSIDLMSYSIGASQTGTFGGGGGGGAGKANFQDLHFTMKMSKASPKLFLACANGEHIKKAVLTLRKAGKTQVEFTKVTLSDVLVSSYQHSASGGGDEVPIESISFNYTKIEWDYKEQLQTGGLGPSVKAGYDVKANKEV